jgi:hypothetical protein
MRNPVGFMVELESLLVSSSLAWRNKTGPGSFEEKL